MDIELFEIMIHKLIDGEQPTKVYEFMLNTYPEFREFVESKTGRTTERIAEEYDLNVRILQWNANFWRKMTKIGVWMYDSDIYVGNIKK